MKSPQHNVMSQINSGLCSWFCGCREITESWAADLPSVPRQDQNLWQHLWQMQVKLPLKSVGMKIPQS